jgi:RND family efflux transporter MFP subunit
MKIDFKKRKIQAVTVVMVVFLGYIGWEAYRRTKAAAGDQPQSQRAVTVAVEIGPVVTGSITDVGQFSGTLIPKSSFTVVPKISGRLKRLLIDIGDTVTRGQLVAVLEDEEYQQDVLQAEADLRVARANLEEAASTLEMARKDLERARALQEKGIQSQSELDAIASRFDAQRARHKVSTALIANRESALASARVRLSYTRIKASWEMGSEVRFVGERFVSEGAMLSPNTQILSIIELRPITAVVFVTDRDYFRLGVDQPATVTSSAFGGESFAGRVARIAPLLQESSREARVEIEIQNEKELLKPGMFINTRIEFSRRESAVIVPVRSLVNRTGQQGIFQVDLENKKAVFLPVKVGIIEGERAEILEPVSLSGYVVTLGHHLLEDGTALILPQGAPRSAGTVPAAAASTPAKTVSTK